MHVFYCSEIFGNRIVLDENESSHAARVLRTNVGDRAWVLDGKGHKYTAQFNIVHHKKCELEVNDTEFKKNDRHIHIAIAPTKSNDRMEWFLEKVTEMGVASVTPVICEHSERRTVNPDRYMRVILAAMKQSMNFWLPELKPVLSFNIFIESSEPGFIAYCKTDTGDSLIRKMSALPEYNVLIGPEGDFTEIEIASAQSKGWQPVSLGNTRLRTETAGVIACNTIMVVDELLSTLTTNK